MSAYALLGPQHEKTCLRGFQQVRFKPVSLATGTS